MDPHTVFPATPNTPAGGEALSPANPYVPLSYAELRPAGEACRDWLWQGYLLPGAMTLLTSLWKSGKSTLLAVLLSRLKAGGVLAGLPVRAGRAVVVSEESPEVWWDRGHGLTLDGHVRWFCKPFQGRPTPEQWLDLLGQVGRMHDREPVDLLAIDPLAHLAAMRSENDSAEMMRAVAPLQRLTSRGVSVLLCHHPRKGPGGARPGGAGQRGAVGPGGRHRGNGGGLPAEPEGPAPAAAGLLAVRRHADVGDRVGRGRHGLPRAGAVRGAGLRARLAGAAGGAGAGRGADDAAGHPPGVAGHGAGAGADDVVEVAQPGGAGRGRCCKVEWGRARSRSSITCRAWPRSGRRGSWWSSTRRLEGDAGTAGPS